MSEDYNTAIPDTLSSASTPVITLPLTALLESLLFVADGPVPLAQYAQALNTTLRTIEVALTELETLYQQRGLRIQREKSGIQLTTAPQAAEAVEKFLGLESLQRLSKPAVETLAIVAYQQPVTRPYIESIRGVNSDGVIKSLLTKGLIEEVGRTEGPGRPVLYATTSTFLQHFGLAALTELPPLDIESLLAAARVTAEQNLQVSSEADPASTHDQVDVSASSPDQPNADESQTDTEPQSDTLDGRGLLIPDADEPSSATLDPEPDLSNTGNSVADSQPEPSPISQLDSEEDEEEEDDNDDDWDDDEDDEDEDD